MSHVPMTRPEEVIAVHHQNYGFEVTFTALSGDRILRLGINEFSVSEDGGETWEQIFDRDQYVYDVTVDPHNVHNLANDPAYNDDLVRMRKALKRWVRENHDAGFLHEGLMIELAGGQTIYELTHAPDYPNERIIETAEMASDTNPDHMPALITRRADPHPAVRFWAAAGFAVPGARVKEAVPALKKLLGDPVADVRITAAEALCKAGEKKESQALLIGELENENPRVQLYALNVLDALGNDTQAVMKELFLAAMSRKERDEYFQRAYMHLIQTLKPGWEDYIVW